MILPVDESAEQTLRVMKSLIYQNTKKGILAGKEKELIQRKYKAIQKCLRKVILIMPDDLAESITFNSERISYKRRFSWYLSLIHSIALHRQYQRKIFTEKDSTGKLFDMIYIEKRDVIDANRIITELFGTTLGELNPVNEKCLNDITRYCKEKSKELNMKYYEIMFTRKEIRDYANWEHMPLRRAFEKLFDMEYIVRSFGKDRARFYYKLNIDEETGDDGIKLNLYTPR